MAALRAAAAVKSQLRRSLAAHLLRLGPAWLGRQQPGEVATVTTRGMDGLDSYFARYLPQLVLACLVPAAVLATVAAADWVSAVIIAVTLPLIPFFAALNGRYCSAAMATLRVAFLSALVLEIAAALATALVAVEVGLRLLPATWNTRPRCWCC